MRRLALTNNRNGTSKMATQSMPQNHRPRKTIRPIRVDGDIAYVTLTQGYEAIIDAADLHLIDDWNWTASISEWHVCAYRRRHKSLGRPSYFPMHRQILQAPIGVEVDHIDGNALNNTRRNLRIATSQENKRNRRRNKNNTTGFKGVTYDKSRNTYNASMMVDRKRVSLGRYASPTEAYQAYIEAASSKFGEFFNDGSSRAIRETP
jgi:hypothetical protein